MDRGENNLDMLDFYIRQCENTNNQINILQNRLNGLYECINDIYFHYENIDNHSSNNNYSNPNYHNYYRGYRRNRNRDRTINRSVDLSSNHTINRERSNTNVNANVRERNRYRTRDRSSNRTVPDRINNINVPLPHPRRDNNMLSHIYNESTSPLTQDIWNSFLNNVLIVPTSEQIENATIRINYSDISNPLNESCPISLERFSQEDTVTQISHCGHIFNSQQLTEWFQTNVRCPVCRYDIRETTINTNTNTTNNIAEQEISVVEEPSIVNNLSQINTSVVDRLSEYITNNNILNNNNNNNFDRIMYDASNNMLLFETIIQYPSARR